MSSHRNWTREETILAFELYCTIPSNKVTVTNPKIIALATALGRTQNSVKLKLQNFKSYDPSYTQDGRIGLSHGSKVDAEIVSEFISNWDLLILQADDIKHRVSLQPTDEPINPIGKNAVYEHKTRIGQHFFRQALLSSYRGKCCITGLAITELLRASHIKPWAQSNDINEKTNPRNGLLLNALHDAAFDKGYITIDTQLRVVVSPLVKEEQSTEILLQYAGKQIALPDKFEPDINFIKYHNSTIFRGANNA